MPRPPAGYFTKRLAEAWLRDVLDRDQLGSGVSACVGHGSDHLKWCSYEADLGTVSSILLRRYSVVGLVALLVGGYLALHQSSSGASAGSFAGTTSQGLPISFTVTSSSVDSIMFTWQAVCADGQSHTNTIILGSAPLAGGSFATGGTLNTGASSSVSGKIQSDTASGVLSRSGPSVFGTDCTDTGVRWQAHRVG